MFIVGFLQQFEDKAAQRQKRLPATIVVKSLGDALGNISSMYLKETNQIIVNEKVLNELTSVELIATVFHEGRHAQQWHQINHPNDAFEDVSVLEKWKNEFLSYDQTSANSNTKAYLTLAIEVDAVAYTTLNMLRLSNLKMQVHPDMKLLVDKRIEEISTRPDNF